MSATPESLKPNRTPWIIAGVLGCLVICLIVAVLGVGGYALFGQSPARVVPTVAVQNLPTVPPVVVPTVPSITVVVPTIPPIAQPTQVSLASPVPPRTQPVQSGTPGAQPTLAPVAQPTQQPAASPTATKPAAPSGKIAFSVNKGDRPEDQYVWIMNSDGSGAKQILQKATSPSFSPDGTKITYYSVRDGIYVANADGTNPKKILGDTFTWSVEWSHDGRFIAISSQPGGSGNIVIDEIPPDGSALKDPSARRNITTGESPSWSPDDTQLAFHTCRGSSCGIYKSSSVPGSEAVPIIADDGGLAAWSADGKEIVYQKDVDGQKELFLINPDGSGKKQLTQGPAMHVDAEWSSDSNFIFYRSPEGGTWGIWRMNADGSSPVKLIDNMGPTNWPYERLAVTR